MDFEYFRQTRFSTPPEGVKSEFSDSNSDIDEAPTVDGEDLGEAIVFLKEVAACAQGYAERLRRMGCLSDQAMADTEKLLKDIEDFVDCYTLEEA